MADKSSKAEHKFWGLQPVIKEGMLRDGMKRPPEVEPLGPTLICYFLTFYRRGGASNHGGTEWSHPRVEET
jgi:hypothetical protein